MELDTKSKVSYGLGGFGKNVAYTFVASYTLYYYNTVLSISAAFIGTMLMAMRIFDAFNDPFMGVLVARTRSRHGKYKPWILSGAVLNALVIVAMFSVPKALSMGGVKTYVVITYLICGITYTLTDIPYWSIIPAITKPGKIREDLTVFARMFSGIGSGVPTVFTMFFVSLLGSGTGREAYRSGFSRLSVIIAVMYVSLTIITVLHIPDTKEDDSVLPTFGELFKALFKNDKAMVVSLIIILFYSATSLTVNLVIYVFDYDISRADLYTPFMAVIGVMQLLPMLLYPWLRKFYSNRRIFIVGISLALIGYISLVFLIPVEKYTMALILLPCCLIAAANGTAYVLTTVLVADAVDYGEKKNGRRDNSMVSSLQTLMVKLSSAFAVFFSGLGIELIKITDTVSQSEATIRGLHIIFSIPSLLLAFGAIILLMRRKDI